MNEMNKRIYPYKGSPISQKWMILLKRGHKMPFSPDLTLALSACAHCLSVLLQKTLQLLLTL